MNHIKQNNPLCLPVMQKSGCFVRCCGLISEYKTGKALTAEQINDLWQWGKKYGYINVDDNVTASAPLATRALSMLNSPGRWIEVGTFRGGITYWYPGIKTEFRRIDALIQKIKQNGPQKTHFRVVDRTGTVIEDPYDPPIKAVGIHYSILYAYIGGII